MDTVVFCLFFIQCGNVLAHISRSPEAGRNAHWGSGSIFLEFSFFFSFLFLMCWLHPQVCSMMLQAIMSRHDSPEGERWPFSCDSSSEGRKPFPKVPRQYYPPVPRLYLGHMTLPDTTMAKRIGITNTWLRTILIPGEARVQLPQGMRSGGYLTRTETLLGRKKCNSCRQPATP